MLHHICAGRGTHPAGTARQKPFTRPLLMVTYPLEGRSQPNCFMAPASRMAVAVVWWEIGISSTYFRRSELATVSVV